MCFSAEVSFGTAVALTCVGIATLRQALAKKRLFLIGLIPLLFAIQQVAEGFVWLRLGDQSTRPLGVDSVVFLFFAWVVWPVFIPLAVLSAETVSWKRMVCTIAFFSGIWIAVFDIYYLTQAEVHPAVSGGSLYYGFEHWLDRVVYSLSILIPLFISSVPKLWVFGLAGWASFLVTEMAWSATFTSVWCFFAAIASSLLYFIVKKAPS